MIYKKRKHWWQKRHTFGAVMGEAAHGEASRFEREDAVEMAADANTAAAAVYRDARSATRTLASNRNSPNRSAATAARVIPARVRNGSAVVRAAGIS